MGEEDLGDQIYSRFYKTPYLGLGKNLNYSAIINIYEKISSTTKRLEITDHLAKLFQNTSPQIIDKVVYLTQGKLYPDYMGVELGIAEKLAVRSISETSGINEKTVIIHLSEKGDIGEVASELLKKRTQTTLATSEPLTVKRVYETLDKIARASGEGSQEVKLRLLSGLLTDASPTEAKYIIRTVTGRMRLGLADMTILDGLAVAFRGSKKERPVLERAYNISSDLGNLAKILSDKVL